MPSLLQADPSVIPVLLGKASLAIHVHREPAVLRPLAPAEAQASRSWWLREYHTLVTPPSPSSIIIFKGPQLWEFP